MCLQSLEGKLLPQLAFLSGLRRPVSDEGVILVEDLDAVVMLRRDDEDGADGDAAAQDGTHVVQQQQAALRVAIAAWHVSKMPFPEAVYEGKVRRGERRD